MIGKWNYETKEYDEYKPGWELVLMAEMDTLVHCAQCGAKLPYGNAYTSQEVHTPVGMGYPVCTICYEEECVRRRAHRD